MCIYETLLQNIEDVTMESEMNVVTSLCNAYSKAAVILEYASDETISDFGIFQEVADSTETTVDAKKESIIKKILLFIPRIIGRLVNFIKQKWNNRRSKQLLTRIDELERAVKDQDGKFNELERAVKDQDGKFNELKRIDSKLNAKLDTVKKDLLKEIVEAHDLSERYADAIKDKLADMTSKNYTEILKWVARQGFLTEHDANRIKTNIEKETERLFKVYDMEDNENRLNIETTTNSIDGSRHYFMSFAGDTSGEQCYFEIKPRGLVFEKELPFLFTEDALITLSKMERYLDHLLSAKDINDLFESIESHLSLGGGFHTSVSFKRQSGGNKTIEWDILRKHVSKLIEGTDQTYKKSKLIINKMQKIDPTTITKNGKVDITALQTHINMLTGQVKDVELTVRILVEFSAKIDKIIGERKLGNHL